MTLHHFLLINDLRRISYIIPAVYCLHSVVPYFYIMNNIDLNKQVANDWIKSFNAHDLDKLISLYAEDAIHFSPKLKVRQPETKGWVTDKVALNDWWADAFERLPTLQYELINLVVGEQQVVLEYLRKVNGEPDMMVAEFLEIENGLIIKSRVYHG